MPKLRLHTTFSIGFAAGNLMLSVLFIAVTHGVWSSIRHRDDIQGGAAFAINIPLILLQILTIFSGFVTLGVILIRKPNGAEERWIRTGTLAALVPWLCLTLHFSFLMISSFWG